MDGCRLRGGAHLRSGPGHVDALKCRRGYPGGDQTRPESLRIPLWGGYRGCGGHGFDPPAAKPCRSSSGDLSAAVCHYPGRCRVPLAAMPVAGCGLSANRGTGDVPRPHPGPRLCCGMRGQRIRRPDVRPDAALGRSEPGAGTGLRGHHHGGCGSGLRSKTGKKPSSGRACPEMAFGGHIPDGPDGRFR